MNYRQLQYVCIYNTNVYVHCRKISNLFICSQCKLILYLTTMYIYCVYPAISKSPKQLPNCLKIAETNVFLNVFKGTLALILLLFLSVAQQE